MPVRWVGLVAVVFGAVGCAEDGGSFARQAIPDFSRFMHSSAGRHITLYWDCVRTAPASLRLEGVGVNRWESIPPRFLEFTLSGVDAEGRVLSRTRSAAQGVNLLQGFPAPFRMELKEQGGEVRVDLLYQYQIMDDSFDRFSRMLPSTITQQVRDACSSDAHRNRS